MLDHLMNTGHEFMKEKFNYTFNHTFNYTF